MACTKELITGITEYDFTRIFRKLNELGYNWSQKKSGSSRSYYNDNIEMIIRKINKRDRKSGLTKEFSQYLDGGVFSIEYRENRRPEENYGPYSGVVFDEKSRMMYALIMLCISYIQDGLEKVKKRELYNKLLPYLEGEENKLMYHFDLEDKHINHLRKKSCQKF